MYLQTLTISSAFGHLVQHATGKQKVLPCMRPGVPTVSRTTQKGTLVLQFETTPLCSGCLEHADSMQACRSSIIRFFLSSALSAASLSRMLAKAMLPATTRQSRFTELLRRRCRLKKQIVRMPYLGWTISDFGVTYFGGRFPS